MFDLIVAYFGMMGTGVWISIMAFEGFHMYKLLFLLACLLWPTMYFHKTFYGG